MLPELLVKNLRILEERHPRVHRQVLSRPGAGGPGGPRVLAAASGAPTLEAGRGDKRFLLHSRSDPAREARRLAETLLSGDEDLVAVGGMGLGYLPEAVLARCTRARVVVGEPDIDVLVKALETRDLSPVLGDDRTALVLDWGGGELGEDSWSWETVTGGSPPRQARFVSTRGYRLLYGGPLQRWESSLLDYQRRNRINTATLDRFDRLWTRNTFRNAHLFFTLQGVGALQGVLGGVPAVVLGAGPSLECCVDLLREARREVVLIASDTVLLPLLRWGILPDFVVTVDPQYVNSLSLCAARPLLAETAREDRAPLLVADPAVHPASLRRYPGIRVLTSSVFA
ncbi:MAG: 6-hydroxymethylpterin diphosphokinase MptE-like protein, partial [Spirochaetota bacterium]